MKKERITRAMIQREACFLYNKPVYDAWQTLCSCGEDNMLLINREWKKSWYKDWKTFIICYAEQM